MVLVHSSTYMYPGQQQQHPPIVVVRGIPRCQALLDRLIKLAWSLHSWDSHHQHCMCTCICMCVHVCVYMYVCTCTYMYVYVCVYVYVHVCVVCIDVCMDVYVCGCGGFCSCSTNLVVLSNTCLENYLQFA